MHAFDRYRRAGLREVALAGLTLALAVGSCRRSEKEDLVAPLPTGGHLYVAAPTDVHYGGSYAQWSQRWWQWAFELPRVGHPLYDQVGVDAFWAAA